MQHFEGGTFGVLFDRQVIGLQRDSFDPPSV